MFFSFLNIWASKLKLDEICFYNIYIFPFSFIVFYATFCLNEPKRKKVKKESKTYNNIKMMMMMSMFFSFYNSFIFPKSEI